MSMNWSAALGCSTVGAPFLINENCEGTGTPATWTDVAGSPNWDYTTIPLSDAQSLYLSTATAAARVRVEWTDKTEIWWYFLLRLTNGTATASSITSVSLVNGAGGVGTATGLSINTTGHPRVGATPTTDAFIIDTTYHVWCHYLKGTGANATLDVGFSTDGVRPTSGTKFAQETTNGSTTNAGRLTQGTPGITLACDLIVDNIRVRDSVIGDNGT